MAGFQSQQLQALSAHVEGLEAALGALPDDPETGASLRRIARSLRSTAEQEGAAALAASARRIEAADDDGLEPAARAFLAQVEALLEESATGRMHVLLVEDNRTLAAAVQ